MHSLQTIAPDGNKMFKSRGTAANDDHQNHGMTKGTAAVQATGATLAEPVFKAVAA